MLTAQDICWLLRKKYAPPDYAIAFEVGDSTGLNVRRHADAVSMSLWPSRGLELLGFEIKVSRGDLRKEVETPEKAEPLAKYCDGWYVVCPAELNILDIEVPLNWGIMVARDGELKVKRSAQRNENPTPVTRSFLAALFRAMCAEDSFRAEKMIEEKRRELESGFHEKLEAHVRLRQGEITERMKFADELIKHLEESGFRWVDIRWREKTFAKAVTRYMKEEMPAETIARMCDCMEDCVRRLRSGLNTREIPETA